MKQEKGKGGEEVDGERKWDALNKKSIITVTQSSLYYHFLSLKISACGFLFKPTDHKSDNGFKVLVRLCLTVIV